MYAAYALSSIMDPNQPLAGMRSDGAIPALITVLNNSVLATKKGAMRALGRLARSDEAAAEIVEADGLPPIVALLDCEGNSGLVRRWATSSHCGASDAYLVTPFFWIHFTAGQPLLYFPDAGLRK